MMSLFYNVLLRITNIVKTDFDYGSYCYGGGGGENITVHVACMLAEI